MLRFSRGFFDSADKSVPQEPDGLHHSAFSGSNVFLGFFSHVKKSFMLLCLSAGFSVLIVLRTVAFVSLCVQDGELVDHYQMDCQADGSWSSSPPHCQCKKRPTTNAHRSAPHRELLKWKDFSFVPFFYLTKRNSWDYTEIPTGRHESSSKHKSAGRKESPNIRLKNKTTSPVCVSEVFVSLNVECELWLYSSRLCST